MNKSYFKKGYTPWNKGMTGSKSHMFGLKTGEKHHAWKGDNVGYDALHDWVTSKLGRPRYCRHCKVKDAKRYEWANISHKYKRKLSDWARLCSRCHALYDRNKIKLEDNE